jgi:hypothetical protein
MSEVRSFLATLKKFQRDFTDPLQLRVLNVTVTALEEAIQDSSPPIA